MNIIFCLRSKVTDNALNTDKSESKKDILLTCSSNRYNLTPRAVPIIITYSKTIAISLAWLQAFELIAFSKATEGQ